MGPLPHHGQRLTAARVREAVAAHGPRADQPLHLAQTHRVSSASQPLQSSTSSGLRWAMLMLTSHSPRPRAAQPAMAAVYLPGSQASAPITAAPAPSNLACKGAVGTRAKVRQGYLLSPHPHVTSERVAGP